MIERSARIELGCGPSGSSRGMIGVDQFPGPGVDIVGDALDVMRGVPDDWVAEIYCRHFLEHVEDVPSLLRECSRALQPGGKLHIIVPHFSNPHFYSDPTHRNFFGLYSFEYLAGGSNFRRTVPSYALVGDLECSSVKYGFGSFRPHYVRHGIKKVWQRLFNLSTYMKELYEENLCWMIPCHEIEYVIRKKPA